MDSLGLTTGNERLTLKEGAVPTIFDLESEGSQTDERKKEIHNIETQVGYAQSWKVIVSRQKTRDFDEITSLASETTDEEYTGVLEDSYQRRKAPIQKASKPMCLRAVDTHKHLSAKMQSLHNAVCQTHTPATVPPMRARRRAITRYHLEDCDSATTNRIQVLILQRKNGYQTVTAKYRTRCKMRETKTKVRPWNANIWCSNHVCYSSSLYADFVWHQHPRLIARKMVPMISVTTMCMNGHTYLWNSQPENNRMPWGNFLVAASCLFSGSQPSKVLTFFKHLNLACISERLYSLVQSSNLVPSVFELWKEHQLEILSKYKNEKLTIGGDGRNDTPGHTAKYGSYSVMDLDSNKILDVQLVQSTECGGSAYMELEGFKRCIGTMERQNITIGTLVSDRHTQIRKYMRQKHPEIKHYFDVFMLQKELVRKLKK
eukprot:gene21111-23177_t